MRLNESMLMALLIDIQNDIDYMKRLLEKLQETKEDDNNG